MDGPPAAKKVKITQELDHHQRLEYCRTRAKYRAGRNLTAVKVGISILIQKFTIKDIVYINA